VDADDLRVLARELDAGDDTALSDEILRTVRETVVR
jgi:hypothetical protein